MRLLNTTTLRLHTFHEPDLPDYAILSHTWRNEDDEVSFQELQSLNSTRGCQCGKEEQDRLTRAKGGYLKIRQCCHQAKEYGLDYAWVDTCCT